MIGDVSRRRGKALAGPLGALLLAAAALAAGPVETASAAGDKTVVFAGWGGSIQKAQREVMFNAFEKATGIKVIDVPDVQLGKIKAMVEAGNVEWDVAEALGMWVPEGEKQNLWEKLDYEIIDRKGVPDSLSGPHGIGVATYGIILAYNEKAFPPGKAPNSWKDFWNVKDFPGPRGLFDGPRYSIDGAMLADGASPKSLYPIDLDRAFRSLDRIKSQVHVWWKQWPQPPLLLTSGELAISLTSSTRIAAIRKEEHAPVKVIWNQGLMTIDQLAVPRGAPHRENAMKLIAWMVDAKHQAALARQAAIGPSNTDALKGLTDAEKEDLPLYHYQKGELVLFDNAWWAENEEKAQERWNLWKLK
jgi:putative spermidine/putrescine transport system substrate-binding protein